MKTKICTKCLLEKILTDFYTHKFAKDGFRSWCKTCVDIQNKDYFNKHKQQIKYYYRLYKIENKEYITERDKKWRKIYRQENKDIIKEKGKIYYQENKEKIKLYKNIHKEERHIYNKEKYFSDINFKLRRNISARLLLALKQNWKSGHTLKLLGCSIDFLKIYLEKQFIEGMSWNNHGTGNNGKGMQEWQIDHKLPCASFDLSKPSQQRKCFHYTNLQPIWATENRLKNNNFIKEK